MIPLLKVSLLEFSFTTTTNFAASSMWQVNGGYAAKWHTITVLGSFDLLYGISRYSRRKKVIMATSSATFGGGAGNTGVPMLVSTGSSTQHQLVLLHKLVH